MCPQLVQIGPFTVYSFGLLVVAGFFAGVHLAARLAQERGLEGSVLLDGAVLMLFAGIVGARLLFVALNAQEYGRDLLQIGALWQGGMSFHGGVIAGVATGFLYVRSRRQPALALADAAAPGLALGYAIGRLGCLMNGCCYGGPTTLPWGMHFPPPAEAHLLYHPAQVYAALINLAFVPLLIAAYRRPHRAGQVLALYVGLYSTYRFLIESLRKGITAEVFAFGLTEAQCFSLLTLALAGAGWVWLARRGAPAPTPSPAPQAP
jgi:phosphatidylglycerol:prolipoprotein diacylglycerol transferase